MTRDEVFQDLYRDPTAPMETIQSRSLFTGHPRGGVCQETQTQTEHARLRMFDYSAFGMMERKEGDMEGTASDEKHEQTWKVGMACKRVPRGEEERFDGNDAPSARRFFAALPETLEQVCKERRVRLMTEQAEKEKYGHQRLFGDLAHRKGEKCKRSLDLDSAHAHAQAQTQNDGLDALDRTSLLSIPRREGLPARGILDLHHEVLRLGERVLELEGVCRDRDVFGCRCVGEYRSFLSGMNQLEGGVFDNEAAAPTTINRNTADLQMEKEDGGDEHFGCGNMVIAEEAAASMEIPGLRLRYGDGEEKCATLPEHFFRTWISRTSKESPVAPRSPDMTTYGGGVLLHPIVRENDVSSAPVSAEPMVKKMNQSGCMSAFEWSAPIVRENAVVPVSAAPISGESTFKTMHQPGHTSTFDFPVEPPPRFFRRRYGGGYPDGHAQDRDDTPRPIFPKRIIWNTNEPAVVHPTSLPPSQPSRFRQPTVTEEAEEDFVDAARDKPALRGSSATTGLWNIALPRPRSRDRMLRLHPGNHGVDLDPIPTLGPRVPLLHAGFGARGEDSGPSSFTRRAKGGNQDLFADRRIPRFGPPLAVERGNAAFGGGAGDLFSGGGLASCALQPRGGGWARQSAAAAGHRGSKHRRPFMPGMMTWKGEGQIDDGPGVALDFFDGCK